MEKEILEEIVNGIVKEAEKILGQIVIAKIKEIPEIKVEGEKITISKADGKLIIEKIVSTFETIIGPAIKSIVIAGVVPVFKKHPEKFEEFKKELPRWIFESPDIKVLEMAGITKD